jgi:bifunctional non-homologous end joining protein LigD
MPRTPRPTPDALLEAVGDVQLATLIKGTPAQPEAYRYELKFDGYRILAAAGGREVRLLSRSHQDWTREFEPLLPALTAVSKAPFVLDGEVCALDEANRPSFQLLQNRAGRKARLVYFVFDMLWSGREDLRPRPLEERRSALENLLGGSPPDPRIVLSAPMDGEPGAMLRKACKSGYEGLVAKEKGSPYVGGRSRSWLKIKCSLRQEFAIVGYLPFLGTRRGEVGSLVLALYGPDKRFHFAGKVGTGFDNATRRSLGARLEGELAAEPPIVDAPRLGGIARWVRPKLVAEVAFTEWTEGGHVRHPSFQGLRKDKKVTECVREG